MTAHKNNAASLTLNPHLSILRKTDEECLFTLHGAIKRLRWKPGGEVAQWFSTTSGEHANPGRPDSPIAAQLLAANILVPTTPRDEKPSITEANIIGSGYLAELAQCTLRAHTPKARINSLANLAAFTAASSAPNAIHIICPAFATRAELSRLNEQCIQHGRPFGFVFFNGQSLVAGPVVIPGASPCLDCLSTWIWETLSTRQQPQLTHAEFGRIVAAVPYSQHPKDAARRAVQLVVDQLLLACASASCDLAGCQHHVPLGPQPDGTETRFAPHTSCPACHGGFGTAFFTDPDAFPASLCSLFTLTDVPTCKLDNGYRALDGTAARRMVQTAIDAMGATMTVRELRTGPLDDVLPSFRAELSTPGSQKSVLGFGKGIDKDQAYLSAAFEAVERLCSEPRGTTPLLRAPRSAVQDRAMDVQKRIGTVYFYRNNEPFTEETPIDWTWGQCLLTGTPTLVPASMVYVGQTKFAGKFYNASTGGIATGTSTEDALLQGLMETIEHDAWMIWQANAIPGPEIRKETITDDSIQRILRGMEKAGYEVRIRYIATDIGIPVFRVWLVNPGSIEIYASHGFGCHLNKHLALKRAITEAKLSMPQTMYSKTRNTHYASRGNRDILASRHSLFYLHHFTKVDLAHDGNTLSMDAVPNLTTGTVAGDLKKTLRTVTERVPGAQILGVDLTDPHIGIPVVRVISSGLQQLSHPLQVVQDRLFTVPCTMGARTTPLSYMELFNGRYPF